jgi:anti-sigma B factor antagonist
VARAGDAEVTVEPLAGGGTVVQIEGDLDLATSSGLSEALAGTDSSSRIVIDLSECTFLDSSALRVLVAAARTTQEAGGEIALVAKDAAILRVLEIAAVDTLLPVHETLESAL